MGFAAEHRRDAQAVRLAADVTAYGLGVPVEEILSGSRRGRAAAFARQVTMYLANVAFALSYARIAAAVGRDRSTVMHACRVVEDRRDDPMFDGWVGALEALLREAPPPGAGMAETLAPGAGAGEAASTWPR